MKAGRVLGMALVCFLVSPVVFAQANLAVVCNGAGCANYSGIPASQIFGDIASAMAYAKPLSATTHVTVLITPGTYTLSPDIVIDSTMDIEIVGTGTTSADDPTAVILQGSSGNNAIELDGAQSSVIIEGLTITGANNAIWAHNSSKAKITRCYLHGNSSSGILCETGSTLTIANCSLKQNTLDGLQVGAGATATVVFSTIFSNTAHGVYANAAGATASLTDVVVFSNGATPGQGGIIAAAGATITADHTVSVGNTDTDVSAAITPTNTPPGITTVAQLNVDTATWGIIGAGSLLIDVGTPVTGTNDDFLRHQRPAGAQMDIGAHEFGASPGAGTLVNCIVTPSPIPKMVAGTLSVQLRFDGSPVLDPNDVIIVPQGTTHISEWSVSAETPHIPLRVTAQAGTGIFFLTNVKDITTILGTDIAPAGPSTTDVIADGHGVVWVRVNLTPDTPVVVSGQASVGRHVLIDTTAPQMFISAPNGLAAPSFVQYVTPLPSVGPPAIPDANHFGLPGLPGGLRMSLQPSYDDGLIFPNPTTGNGAQAFFNPGSVSDGYFAANGNPSQLNNLNIQVKIAIQDVPPADVTTGNEILALDETYSPTIAVHRQVAGFGDPLPASTTQQTQDQALTGTPGPGGRLVDWVFDTGALPPVTTVNTTYTASGGSNPGYDPVTGLPRDFDNARLSVAWTFNDPAYPFVAGSSTGIPYTGSDNHMAVRFRIRDTAKNVTPQDKLLDPLHLWWMLSTRSRIQPNREGTQVASPDFVWALDRGFNTNAAGQPQPLFTYRLWENLTNDYNGPYVPVTGWFAWSTQNRLSPQQFDALGITASHSARWLLLTVVGADEAGNVEMWPWADANQLLASASSGANWQRFFLKGPGDVFDTTIAAQFWWNNLPPDINSTGAGEQIVGSGPIVPSPTNLAAQRLEAHFILNAIGPLPAGTDVRCVYWELIRENDSNKISGVFPPRPVAAPYTAADASFHLYVPGDFGPNNVLGVNTDLSPYRYLGDASTNPEQRRPVNYVLRAWTFMDKNDNRQWDRNTELGDPAPASFQFTVVPNVADYIQNKNNTDFQPVKVQEEK
ncbi:MAG: right-handed parallel beta-helix repeat-containing protein [Candidatus Hydrogenedentes bacterium]|nr:right-handed parallel beta-helix repeat-containing protein [Candidatus Hydrogenedentota bacterium]